MEAWAQGVRVLGKTARWHPQLAYAGLGMSLQLEWKYLQRTIPGVGTLMGLIAEYLRNNPPIPRTIRGDEITANCRKILGHRVKHSGLGITETQFSAESGYNNSKETSGELVDSLLGGSAFNYVGHRACVRKASLAARRAKMHVDLGELARRKDLREDKRGTASIGQIGMGRGLALYTTALTARSCLGRNSGIIFASDMG